jgi:hypothetical protein
MVCAFINIDIGSVRIGPSGAASPIRVTPTSPPTPGLRADPRMPEKVNAELANEGALADSRCIAF